MKLSVLFNNIKPSNSIYAKTAIKLVLILSWSLLLIHTDSYYSVYVICAICATAATLIDASEHSKRSKRENVVINFSSAIFSLFVLLANYALFLPIYKNLIEILIVLAGGFVVARSILYVLLSHLPSIYAYKNNNSKKSTALSFLIPFLIFSIIYAVYFFLSAYPGNISSDGLDQIGQAINGLRSNHHPVWHTLVIKAVISVGMNIFGNMTDAIALYCICQMLFMASAFSFSISTLYRAGVRPIHLILCGLPFAVLPYHIVFSVSIWKDVVFAGAAIYMLAFMFRTLKHVGNRVVNHIFLLIFTVLFCVWRTNAWIAMAVSAVLILAYLKRRHIKTISVIALALIISWGMRTPFVSALGLKQPDFAESLSIPLQQIARVIVDNGYISNSDRELLDKIMDVDEIDELYLDYISDPIKNEIRSKDQAYLENNKITYLALWIRLGFDNPASYITAWIDQTKGYYNSGYDYWIVLTGVEDNEHGIQNIQKDNMFNSGFHLLLYKMNTHVLFEPFISIGLAVWILAALSIISFLRKKEEAALFIPFLLVIGTLLVAVPVFSEFRYVYFMIVSLPFLITMCFYNFDAKGECKNG